MRALGRLLYRGRRSEVRPVLRRTSLRVCVWKPRSPNDSSSAAPCRCVQCCNLEVQTTRQAQHRVAVLSVAKDFAVCVCGNLELQTTRQAQHRVVVSSVAKDFAACVCGNLELQTTRQAQHHVVVSSVAKDFAVCVCGNLELQTTRQAQHRVVVPSVAKDFAACAATLSGSPISASARRRPCSADHLRVVDRPRE